MKGKKLILSYIRIVLFLDKVVNFINQIGMNNENKSKEY